MTTQHRVVLEGMNIPDTFLLPRITGSIQANILVNDLSTFAVCVRAVTSQPAADLLLTQLAKVLPKPMSKTRIKHLRSKYQQLPATEDPSTYEFESR